jgi:hypothetical protein
MNNKLTELYQLEFEVKETLQVLQTPLSIYWCWGVEPKPININNKGLLLKVNGFLHKDFVLVTLGWDDTYIVTLLDKNHQMIGEPNKGIYFDMLQYTVDKLIETKS